MSKMVPKGDTKTSGPGTKKIRTSDDLELLSLILEENQPLKQRVMRYIEKSLSKDANGQKPTK